MLVEANLAHVKEAFQSRRPDQFATKLLEEILEERKLGRIEGPFEAPIEWGFHTAALPPHLQDDAVDGRGLLRLPPGTPLASVAFPIVTEEDDGTEKVRRGEDWKRSHINRAAVAEDVPSYHTVDDIARAAKTCATRGWPELLCWGHDHEGAYRQLPVRDQLHTLLLLFTQWGPMAFMHAALLFGAKGSVWGYGMISAMITALARALLFTLVFAYVDDFTGIEPQRFASSSFDSFSGLNVLLGLRMKKRKMLPPAATQKRLGVLLALLEHGVEVRVAPRRKHKIFTIILSKGSCRSCRLESLSVWQASALSRLMRCLQGSAGPR